MCSTTYTEWYKSAAHTALISGLGGPLGKAVLLHPFWRRVLEKSRLLHQSITGYPRVKFG